MECSSNSRQTAPIMGCCHGIKWVPSTGNDLPFYTCPNRRAGKVHKPLLVLEQLAACLPRLGIPANTLQRLAVLIANLSNSIEWIGRVSRSAQSISRSAHVRMELPIAYNSQDFSSFQTSGAWLAYQCRVAISSAGIVRKPTRPRDCSFAQRRARPTGKLQRDCRHLLVS